MKRNPVTPLYILAGCWLILLLAACGSVTTTGSGNSTATATPGNSIPTATKVPTRTTPPVKLVLKFECQGAFNPSGSHEKVCVRTLPGASLNIKVTYCLGSVDQSTILKGTFTADKTGYYEWSWTPKATCPGNPPGATGFWKGTADVKAAFDGQNLTSSVAFIV